jgi:hypothetical protein
VASGGRGDGGTAMSEARVARDASVARVAGVDVDTRHWIGGRRVAQARTFTDVSPIDEQPVAEVAAGGAAEVTAAAIGQPAMVEPAMGTPGMDRRGG